jgi:hypothetical protein
MTLKTRIMILAAWAVIAGVILLVGWLTSGSLPEHLTGEVALARNWLGAILLGFVVNYAVAWRYRGSWTVTLVRSLVWAFVAYICISNIVDVFGEHRALAWQILGEDGPGKPEAIAGLRWILALRLAGLISAAICIALGFEKEAGAGEADRAG